MTLHHDDGHTPPPGGEPPRLYPVPDEPPYDPYYDQPPPVVTRPSSSAPSHDPVAEQAVIGAMLLNPAVIPDVRAIISPADHYRPQHEQIHDAILELVDAGQPVDMVTVAAELQRRGELKKIGGAPYLHTCITATPTASNASYYAAQVRDHARIRTLTHVAAKLQQIAHTSDVDQIHGALLTGMDALEEAFRRDAPHHTKNTHTGLVDLGWILTGTPPEMPAPAYTHRTDGNALFYAGKVNGIFGDPEAAKTWVAMTAVIEALAAGGTAAMIDVDHNGPDHTAARLLLLGARPDHLADPNRFRYYEPHEADELLAAVDHITSWAPNVLIIDSIGEVFPMLGVSTNDGDEMTTALRRTCIRPANAGSCVITIDHLPKGEEARKTGFAIGTVAKKRMIRGTYLRAEARVQPAPGQIGRVTLRIEKDPTGSLRKVTPGGYAGTFVLDSTHSETEGVTTWRIEREQAPVDAKTGTFRPTEYMERVSRFIEDNDLCSGRDIEEGVTGQAKHIRTALKILINEGFVSTLPGSGRRAKATLHHSIALYREAEDDHLNPTD